MTTIIINFPEPVRVTYDDTPFYDLYTQFDDPYSQVIKDKPELIEKALNYINLHWEAVNTMPALTADDISLQCAQEIMRTIINRFEI
jgi:hypothetical protein